MTKPPVLLPFKGVWSEYEEELYEAFMETFVQSDVQFFDQPVKAQFRPETRGKGYSFWHVISNAPHPDNRSEACRVPDLRRCERIRWIGWVIQQASSVTDGFTWWENRRGRNVGVVVWAEHMDFAVVLAKRRGYYLLKTAYSGIQPHRRRSFERERAAFWRVQKG